MKKKKKGRSFKKIMAQPSKGQDLGWACNIITVIRRELLQGIYHSREANTSPIFRRRRIKNWRIPLDNKMYVIN